jgi:hypothetical protein
MHTPYVRPYVAIHCNIYGGGKTKTILMKQKSLFFLGEGGIGFPWSFTADAGCHGLRVVGCWSTALKENMKVKGNQHTKIF